MASVRFPGVPRPVSIGSRRLRRRQRRRRRSRPPPRPRRPKAGGRRSRPPVSGRRSWRRQRRRGLRRRKTAAANPLRSRYPPLGLLLRGQGHDLRRADRSDRPRSAGQARRRFRARRNPRHRQRDHRHQEHRDVDLRAGRSARRHLQRCARLRAARAAAGARRDRRHHGERLGHGLHRSRRQAAEDRHSLPRQPAIAQHLSAHRQPGRPPRRRILADLRRPPAGRLARQRHRAAAGDRRAGAHHPQIPQGQAHARAARQVWFSFAGRRRHPQGDRPLPHQYAGFRQHRFRQDHAAQLPDPLHRPRRAHRHLRGRRRTAAAAAARGAPGNAAAEPRRRGSGHDARSGAQLPAHAAGTDHRRRSARTRKRSICCRR